METRWATASDVDVLTDYWYRMASEMSEIDGIPAPDPAKRDKRREMFLREMEAGTIAFRVAVDADGQVVACAGGVLRDEYAFPLATERTLFDWIVNVYTLPVYRGQGIAGLLVEDVCSWLKEKGARRARLWSSSQGKSVYRRLCFTAMIDMEKPLS